ERDAFEHLRYELAGIVDELLHDLATEVVRVIDIKLLQLVVAAEPVSTPTSLQRSFSIVATATMPGSGVPLLRSPVNDCRPRLATQSLVRAIASVATAVASRITSAGSASSRPACSAILSRTGISASSSVFSPAEAPPRC